jgi:isoleucyl-tRNA synthetase
MDAEHFVSKYGADIVRLWASSVEFTNEVPFSEESFAVLTDAYRQFRNILRILLANLSDYTPNPEALANATTLDRWMLSRTQGVIATCREAYEAFDFRKVFQTLNQFVTVDISSLYVDITKDRLYCDAPNTPRRRATQEVMRRVFDALARLLAPVLAFTADEAWEHSGMEKSVHIEVFPQEESEFRDGNLERIVNEWLDLRGVIAQSIEAARQQKLIGNALEATVTVEIADEQLHASAAQRATELEEFFILSEVNVVKGSETKATVAKNPHPRCGRCWRHKLTVGYDPTHPELCDRCASVMAERPSVQP